MFISGMLTSIPLTCPCIPLIASEALSRLFKSSELKILLAIVPLDPPLSLVILSKEASRAAAFSTSPRPSAKSLALSAALSVASAALSISGAISLMLSLFTVPNLPTNAAKSVKISISLEVGAPSTILSFLTTPIAAPAYAIVFIAGFSSSFSTPLTAPIPPATSLIKGAISDITDLTIGRATCTSGIRAVPASIDDCCSSFMVRLSWFAGLSAVLARSP